LHIALSVRLKNGTQKSAALFTQGPLSAVVALKDTSPEAMLTPPSFPGANVSGITAFVLDRSSLGDPQMQAILFTQSPMISVPSLSKAIVIYASPLYASDINPEEFTSFM